MAVLALAAWWWLLRVPSEAIELLAGSFALRALRLPETWHSGIFFDRDEIILRLAKLKNRERGSLLRRRCACNKGYTAQCCLYHRMAKFLPAFHPGERLFKFGVREFMTQTILILSAAGLPDAARMTSKAWRAGHATDLALILE